MYMFVGTLCWSLSWYAFYDFMSSLVLQSSWRGRERWLICFSCLSDVMLLYIFWGSFSRCLGLVCSVIVVFPDHTRLLFFNLVRLPDHAICIFSVIFMKHWSLKPKAASPSFIRCLWTPSKFDIVYAEDTPKHPFVWFNHAFRNTKKSLSYQKVQWLV